MPKEKTVTFSGIALTRMAPSACCFPARASVCGGGKDDGRGRRNAATVNVLIEPVNKVSNADTKARRGMGLDLRRYLKEMSKE